MVFSILLANEEKQQEHELSSGAALCVGPSVAAVPDVPEDVLGCRHYKFRCVLFLGLEKNTAPQRFRVNVRKPATVSAVPRNSNTPASSVHGTMSVC
jgi:hypothetical protein